MTDQHSIEIFSCCLRLLPSCSSIHHQTNIGSTQIYSEDHLFSLQNSIAHLLLEAFLRVEEECLSLLATGYAWSDSFTNKYSSCRWASSWRSFWFCFSLGSACKRKYFRLRCRSLLLVVVVLFVDQVCDQLVQAKRNSDPRVRIVFVQRFN